MNQRRCEGIVMDEKRAMMRAAGEVGFYTLLSRVTGLLRNMVICAVFGAGVMADAFFVAFRIPNLLRRLVGEGVASVAFIPVVTEYLTQRSRAETEEMMQALMGAAIAVLLFLTIAGMLWAEPLAAFSLQDFAARSLT